ncbi:MAG: phosphoribosylformylglycinamidine synthase, partial [Proteobacteria bacterium]|nr:phosphoribosylformylglycinamidine synthase [Pseudomonadota bacterium]
DGAPQVQSLFELIKASTAASPTGVLSAYKDNAAVVEGSACERLFPDPDGVYRAHAEVSHILGKVETHNHPTAISPHPGAATGSGGEIRDEGATGRGGKPKAGLVGFITSDLRLPEAHAPWEPAPDAWIGSPSRIATALDIMTEGPLGAAAFNNEFGRPAILGFFRTYERGDRGFHKPVMLAGGIGAVRPGHVEKSQITDGAALIVLGGPAFLIGLGGGAASSLAQGASAEDLDFASVQRDNAEIERRCQEVIDRCWALGDANPIQSIHDVGAGGLSNAFPELVNDAGLGARLELRAIPTGERDLSPLELWCNEAQERYVLAIAPADVAGFAALCARERAPWAQVGTARADGQLVLADAASPRPPVDMPLEMLLGKPPRMVRHATTIVATKTPLALGDATVAQALDRVLALPTVADKSFLVTIGDRTVGGLVSRDSMIGPFQVPVADCALTCASFDTFAGEVMSIGERPPVALLDAAASARLAIGEAITNLAGAPIGVLGRIKLSCNWMAAAGHPGEDARLYAAVRAASELAIALGIAIPVGKDSMSMRTVWTPTPTPPVTSSVPKPTPVPTSEPAASAPFDLTRSHLGGLASARSGMDFDAEMMHLDSEADRILADTGLSDDPELAALEREARRSLRAEALAPTELATDAVGMLIDRAIASTERLAAKLPGGSTTTVSVPTDASAQPAMIVSPVTLIATAFGPVDDVRKNLTPELRGEGHELLLVDLGGGRGRLGGSCLAQVYAQLGGDPPDLDEPSRLAGFATAMQRLVAAETLTAYHDRSDGGLVVTALEMAFASGLGLELDVTATHRDPFAALFSEELGAILEVPSANVAAVRAAFAAAGLANHVHAIGHARPGDRIRITHGGVLVVDADRRTLRGRWSDVTHRMAARRDDEACAHEEHAARLDPTSTGLTAKVTFAIDPIVSIGAPAIVGTRPRVAIVREQGVNGQIEMAAAFTRAGFDAIDVHMTDLAEGRVDLADCAGVVACGGFSFGDVLGAGRGWAATFRYNARARDALAALVARPQTFLLGVCNGCQMVADLADRLPGTTHWPRFVRNRSDQFEARVVLVELAASPSIFFTGMAGSRLPIANAHGEGRAELSSSDVAALASAGLVAARFVDGTGRVATTYPANPNGSPAGIAAVTTPDGRITAIMPHP